MSRLAFISLVTAAICYVSGYGGLAPVLAAEIVGRLTVETDRFQAEWSNGSLTALRDTSGRTFVRPHKSVRGLTIHQDSGEFQATDSHGDGRLSTNLSTKRSVTRSHACFSDADGRSTGNSLEAQTFYDIESDSGDMVVSQSCRAESAGMWGVGWTVGKIPLQYNLIIPGRSGIRLTSTSTGRRHQFDYPLGWEAQLVIVEGGDCGFYIWADDVKGRFKRLIVERDRDGWQLQLITINDAPFDELTKCQSVPWHINVYEGDWRVPARRYRNWATDHFQPTLIKEQTPSWVRDIRSTVIMGINLPLLEELPKRLIPQQTMLYIPSWRAAGYDRDYPNYDEPTTTLRPFVARAHELGFRVMLHVNYFGVDPLNPAYKQFESYQVRDPWGEHKKYWWLWTRADPEIRFAYINPALKAWRDFFTDAMVRLCRNVPVDSLHLDQTLVVYNDHNGRVDGMSMIEGNVELHRQLRRALPQVALSGEGLNEVTYRFEAFAQRHAWGLNHADATWDRGILQIAHPISSYLFRPFVVINGYLGCASPAHGQLYAAWNEAYEHWGVIPTLKTSLSELRRPSGFTRQFFDEARFWQQQQLDIDLESEWPDDVAFPFRTAEGERVVHMADGRFLHEGREISRTIKDVNQVEGTGRVPGWRAFDDQRLIGLDPHRWYPYFNEPRDAEIFHIVAMPKSMVAETVERQEGMAIVRISSRDVVVADLAEMIDHAEVGSRPFEGEPTRHIGPSTTADGAQFERISTAVLAAHPPWKALHTDPNTGAKDRHGSGEAYARFQITLPEKDRLRFYSEVAMDKASLGKPHSDGATFQCTVRSGEQVIQESLHHDSDHPKVFSIDLTPLAGRDVTLELSLTPGPNRSPSFDWARWISPRIESQMRFQGRVTVAGLPSCSLAVGANGPMPLDLQSHGLSVDAVLPGSIYFLNQKPPQVKLPTDLVQLRRTVVMADDSGHSIDVRSFVGIRPTVSTVGGVARSGLFAHPPNHGRTAAHLAFTLPKNPAVFRSWIGIRDGAKSNGVTCQVQVNGQTVYEQLVVPGNWHPIEIDLARWQGSTIVLSMIVGSNGPYDCDWAHWGAPRIEAR